METSAPLLFAALIGFTHAFEADHLVAVSSLVSRRKKWLPILRDGVYWGLGHTSTIFLIGLLILASRQMLLPGWMEYLEGFVGLMLIGLGLWRAYKWRFQESAPQSNQTEHTHGIAYGVGLIHGLAGSGAVILLAMNSLSDGFTTLLFLILFGLGSVVGMVCAVAVVGLPFSRKLVEWPFLQTFLIWLSVVLCVVYGGWLVANTFFSKLLISSVLIC